MSEKDLKIVLQEHKLWLESGRKKGERAKLSGARVRGKRARYV